MADNPIRCVATFSVSPGDLAQTKALVGDLGALAAASPVDTFTPVYDGDGGSVELSFGFATHDDLDSAVSRLGPDIARLATLAHFDNLHVYGELTESAQAAFEPFRPQLHAYAP